VQTDLKKLKELLSELDMTNFQAELLLQAIAEIEELRTHGYICPQCGLRKLTGLISSGSDIPF
jgi:hypothetical protein